MAARSAFAWTLPGFRRALLREFVVAGLTVSALTTAIGVLGGGGIERPLVLFAVGFALFEILALVILGFAFANSEGHFDLAALPIARQRHKSVALDRRQRAQLADF